MASPFLEKLQVALVTATIVSAGWIVAGAFLLDRQEAREAESIIAERQQPSLDPADSAGAQAAAPTRNMPVASMPDEQEAATLAIPVLNIAATDLADTFTDERGSGARLHEGIDIMAERGASVVSSAPGTVERLFRSDAGGNTIYVRSEDRETIYYYAHLDAYAEGLSEGQQVRRGQRLGSVGSTGNADVAAPHLHFEIMRTTPDAEWWEPATSVNPYPLLVRQRR